MKTKIMRTESILKAQIVSTIALFFLVLNSLSAQLVHPGISHKLSDLERMKHMVAAGIEPFATSFVNLSNEAKAQYTYSVNVVNQDPSYITEYSGASDAWFINDGTAAYYNALMWYITGDARHAEKAIEIFNTWKGLKRNTMSVPLSSGRIWRIIEAAEIIKHTYDGWAASDIQEFKDMLVYPGYSTTTVPTAAIASSDITFYWRVYQGDPARHGNQGLFCMRTMMAMGIFLDNEVMYDRALRYLKGDASRSDDIAYPSGPSIVSGQKTSCEYFEEYSRTGSATTIADYGYNEVIENYIYENGQCQESSRDQAHGLAGVATITVMSEMAWNQGDNLYGHLDNRPLLGLEFYYRYNLSYDNVYADQLTPWEPTVASGEYIERTDRSGRWKSLKINPYLVCSTGDEYLERSKHNLRPVYEMNLGHYRDRIGLPSEDYKWLQRGFDYMTEQQGVENGGTVTDHPGYGGLKFHRVSPGDPISGFDENGLPIYKIHELPVTIEAENYDDFVLDGEGRTYSDTSESNEGAEYRTEEAVDINVCSEGGYAVTNIAAGEWLTYTVNVPVNGTYGIAIRYAAANANGNLQVSFDGETKTSEVTVPFGASNSTGLTDWQDFTVSNNINLVKGVQAMKILFSGAAASFDLNAITIDLMEAEPEPINLAVAHGVATQSSTAYKGPAELAIDGTTNGSYGGGSVTHTAHGVNGSETLKWWQVDLQAEYNIETIQVYNRTGGTNYSERLNGITVEVLDSDGNTTFSEFYEAYPNPLWSIATGGVIGNYVRVSKTSDYGMTLAEVEVFGIDKVLTSANTLQKTQVKIYPNPVTDTFILADCKNASLQVYSVLGKLVLQKEILQEQEIIDIRAFKNGVYFVEIHKNGNKTRTKIIKK